MTDEPNSVRKGLDPLNDPRPTGADRRRCCRYRCEGFAEVYLFGRETMIRGEILDLSLTGCFVATRAQVHVDIHSQAAIRFTLRNHQYKTMAEVASIRPGVGIGLDFHHLEKSVVESFGFLVDDYANAGVPDSKVYG